MKLRPTAVRRDQTLVVKMARQGRSQTLHSGRYPYLAPFILINALFLGLPAASQGQSRPPNYTLDHWTVADGLPSNALTQVLQTADGYLWIGTEEGLVRFDGFRFATFDRVNTSGLPHDHIEQMLAAPDSTLWIQTAEHQAVHYRNGQFTAYDTEAGLPRGATYIQPSWKDVFLNGAGQLFRYSSGVIDTVREQPPNTYGGFFQDRQGTYWFPTHEHGLIRYREGNYRAFTLEEGLYSDRIRSIMEDVREPGRLWFLAGGRLHRLEGEQVTVAPLQLELTNAFQEPSGRWWLATASELYRSAVDDFTQVVRVDTIGADFGWDPKVDAEGNVWIQSRQRLWRGGQEVFYNPDIRSFILDESGSVWIGTGNHGLYRLRPVPFEIFGLTEGFAHPVVFPVLEDRIGTIWAGTRDGGLHRIVSGNVESAAIQSLPSNQVYALHEDRRGILWVGTGGGVCRMEGKES